MTELGSSGVFDVSNTVNRTKPFTRGSAPSNPTPRSRLPNHRHQTPGEAGDDWG
jgi:hypothetical protein